MQIFSAIEAASETLWDVAVIGGGPAGMMAAGRAASLGARVILIEKNHSLGKKLLITGGGRCNVTNAEPDRQKFLAKYKDDGKFLASPFAAWGILETLDFFHTRNMQTKVEAHQRVFPVSDSSQSVWDVLVAYLRESSVTILSDATVTGLSTDESNVTHANIRGGKIIRAKSFVLATGGTSHPETGSTGDGYTWLRTLGHTVREPSASLVPIALTEPVKDAAGVSLPDAKITLFQNNVKQAQSRGKVLFTHVGLSGPGILNMSREVDELLKYGNVTIELDLMADMGYEKVNASLQALFKENSNKVIRNALRTVVAPALVPHILSRTGIDPDTACHSVTRDSRIALMKTLKHLRFEVSHVLGSEKAIITSGGVALTEIDFKTMSSHMYENLYIIGDLLDIDRPSGGYSLQLCWTTGYVAGSSAAASVANKKNK